MTEWIEYTGSDAQIEEILTAKHGFIVDSQVSIFHKPLSIKLANMDKEFLKAHFAEYRVNRYLICHPHQLADMISQWAKTGQPVYCRIHVEGYGLCTSASNTPRWDVPDAEYSFTPFKEEEE